MGAASLTQGLRITRPQTVSSYYKYVSQIEQKKDVLPGVHKLNVYDENNPMAELESVLMSGLRTQEGVSWSKIEQIFEKTSDKPR